MLTVSLQSSLPGTYVAVLIRRADLRSATVARWESASAERMHTVARKYTEWNDPRPLTTYLSHLDAKAGHLDRISRKCDEDPSKQEAVFPHEIGHSGTGRYSLDQV